MHICSAPTYHHDHGSLQNIIHYVRQEHYCRPLGSQGCHGPYDLYMGVGRQFHHYRGFAVQASRALELFGQKLLQSGQILSELSLLRCSHLLGRKETDMSYLFTESLERLFQYRRYSHRRGDCNLHNGHHWTDSYSTQ